ncbi:hypothetical protein Ae201684P_013510 [Aphanomyces euteiches]|nr:hypothetical protein Ae201684P_013510 [Aphanomyces euteiches]
MLPLFASVCRCCPWSCRDVVAAYCAVLLLLWSLVCRVVALPWSAAALSVLLLWSLALLCRCFCCRVRAAACYASVRTTCRSNDLPWAIGFKEDKIQGVQGVQEQEPAGANSERSNLRPFVSVGTQGLTRLSARGLIRLAFEKKASKAFKEEKREDLFSSRLCFCGVANASLEVPKKAGCGV